MAGGDAGQQLEVVLEDQRLYRLRGHVDHARPRVAQPDEQEKEALLVEARPGELFQARPVEGERGHDDRGVRLLVAHGERAPDVAQAWFEPLEGGDLLLRLQLPGEWRL